MSSDLTYEWIVREDGDPRNVITYRGPDEDLARAALARIHVMRGWGGSLSRRLVGPEEIVETRK